MARWSTLCERAFDEMGDIVAGAKVNADEDRMVGHYWLRDADLAPAAEKAKIEAVRQHEVPAFAAQVHSGEFAAPGGGKLRTCSSSIGASVVLTGR
ncbi:MAG: hypothetical protein R3F11_06720 [Verrucomicrobiales bacterium]